MTLYNCRSADDTWRITKFDNDLNPQASYLVGPDACECPAGVRPTCRHRQMLPHFIEADAVDQPMYFDWDGDRQWYTLGDVEENAASEDASIYGDLAEIESVAGDNAVQGFAEKLDEASDALAEIKGIRVLSAEILDPEPAEPIDRGEAFAPEPITTEVLDELQFGKALHERPSEIERVTAEPQPTSEAPALKRRF